MKLRHLHPFLTALLILSIGTPLNAAEVAGMQARPSAVDLSKLISSPTPAITKQIQFETLDNKMGTVELMLSAYPQRGGDPDILSVDGKNEASLLAANRQVASRSGKTLTIRRQSEEAFVFRSWAKPGDRSHEGDSETFVYAGPLGNSGYQKVDVNYMHDASGSFLLNTNSGEALFVHSEEDRVSVSKDYKKLMVMNNGLNPPFGLLVVALAQQGHRVEMRCQSSRDNGHNPKIIPYFTGWHIAPYIGFDVVLLVQQLETDSNTRFEAIPVRFTEKNSEWHIFVPEPQRFVRSARLTCWQ